MSQAYFVQCDANGFVCSSGQCPEYAYDLQPVKPGMTRYRVTSLAEVEHYNFDESTGSNISDLTIYTEE